ncbi:Fe superoxide dismutase, putative [Talaromyces stipitatus ATCC 10500]|uniref:Fe superoxide dismutase, putative n=1 Tax=Talaromyces stipitatus (strain ATCC 10500 / CBS 375.48 / QM 6759 / NRRL 1006) TaxID=441959 RepID=B8MGF6_TALSN|nr:Fe superoxide dismutase, putative [Talaromyces stipitatus ATCC 10500]EED16276.1 Fe superoxide dismutase, putative [Talaromyces stipitatus ATCC 10500]
MLQRLIRPQSGLRSASAVVKTSLAGLPRFQYRSLHRVPQLANERIFREHGISEFMSPEAFDFAWTQYQSLLVEKLNLMTQDTADADLDTLALVKKYAKRRETAHLFNYASMAHNNHFFFHRLSPVKVPIPDKLASDMSDSASSPESLKQDFLATASAQFGPGFVWLVAQANTGLLRILSTYNAGTPYPEAFARQQGVDMNNEPTPAAGQTPKFYSFLGLPSSGEATPDLAPGGMPLTPLLCVNTWEHVWMMDHGIGGKDEYLERWWDRVDWNAVEDAHKATVGYNVNLNKRSLSM